MYNPYRNFYKGYIHDKHTEHTRNRAKEKCRIYARARKPWAKPHRKENTMDANKEQIRIIREKLRTAEQQRDAVSRRLLWLGRRQYMAETESEFNRLESEYQEQERLLGILSTYACQLSGELAVAENAAKA